MSAKSVKSAKDPQPQSIQVPTFVDPSDPMCQFEKHPKSNRYLSPNEAQMQYDFGYCAGLIAHHQNDQLAEFLKKTHYIPNALERLGQSKRDAHEMVCHMQVPSEASAVRQYVKEQQEALETGGFVRSKNLDMELAQKAQNLWVLCVLHQNEQAMGMLLDKMLSIETYNAMQYVQDIKHSMPSWDAQRIKEEGFDQPGWEEHIVDRHIWRYLCKGLNGAYSDVLHAYELKSTQALDAQSGALCAALALDDPKTLVQWISEPKIAQLMSQRARFGNISPLISAMASKAIGVLGVMSTHMGWMDQEVSGQLYIESLGRTFDALGGNTHLSSTEKGLTTVMRMLMHAVHIPTHRYQQSSDACDSDIGYIYQQQYSQRVIERFLDTLSPMYQKHMPYLMRHVGGAQKGEQAKHSITDVEILSPLVQMVHSGLEPSHIQWLLESGAKKGYILDWDAKKVSAYARRSTWCDGTLRRQLEQGWWEQRVLESQVPGAQKPAGRTPMHL